MYLALATTDSLASSLELGKLGNTKILVLTCMDQYASPDDAVTNVCLPGEHHTPWPLGLPSLRDISSSSLSLPSCNSLAIFGIPFRSL